MIGALLGAIAATPVAAQMFSEGYEFLKAVKDRDGDAATEALNQPGTTIVNARDLTTGETALHIVTARRDALWIRFLTQRGANPNIRDKKGVSPLQMAQIPAIGEIVAQHQTKGCGRIGGVIR